MLPLTEVGSGQQPSTSLSAQSWSPTATEDRNHLCTLKTSLFGCPSFPVISAQPTPSIALALVQLGTHSHLHHVYLSVTSCLFTSSFNPASEQQASCQVPCWASSRQCHLAQWECSKHWLCPVWGSPNAAIKYQLRSPHAGFKYVCFALSNKKGRAKLKTWKLEDTLLSLDNCFYGIKSKPASEEVTPTSHNKTQGY